MAAVISFLPRGVVWHHTRRNDGQDSDVPVWETSPMGPFDHWRHPGGGFEYVYGFIGGETNQWNPAIYDFNKPVEPDRTPEEGYHFTEDLTDKAITWIRSQKSLKGDKPFFAYYAPGATHVPHHVAASGQPSIGAGSTKAGTGCATRRLPARSSSG
jgi:arylsulfatase A-like enzyme